ncbi:2-oxoglutarate-Fe(II)-dependent oxygenase superfamily protein [Azospirillum brasilense]|uniref:2-oxoglutarate-Fe(II)-dependent oxygenase superfamily protein n=1 Tax=Azospirillum brasilense TaxID=192 RepID=A0A560BRC3_AZOBR|nr:alpha-ketoglutarate-dependent dioxygenase AlkB [Azospirillum brasilense]MBK3736233.1 alpha-ketoglutarate-dependent dioxygenase AlkB [Azospirillum brasilense]TWA75165.1 2-oxoglutarate-Fe(II)-dependent oxygenase superfamily protein [Azospirillum brasilense]
MSADVPLIAACEEGLRIPGLALNNDWIGKAEESQLLKQVDGGNWRNDLKRRVQHYGFRYDYRARSVLPGDHLGPLPGWLAVLAGRLVDKGVFYTVPDQVIVNEYLTGQGISAHIDCVPCFGDTIAILSLGSSVVMTFQCAATGARREMTLPTCSLLRLSGPARYDWLHGIPARKSDMIDGMKTQRLRRVSLTFRSVVIGA